MFSGIPFLLGDVITWITALWIVGLGALVGILFLLFLWGLVAFFSRSAVTWVNQTVHESILWPVFIIAACVAGFGVIASFSVRNPLDIISSITRIPSVGTSTTTDTLPAPQKAPDSDILFQSAEGIVEVSFRITELRKLIFESSEDIVVSSQSEDHAEQSQLWRVSAGEKLDWVIPDKPSLYFPNADVQQLYVRNLGSAEAHIKITTVTDIRYPEVKAVAVLTISLVGLFVLYLAINVLAPKVAAIALSTAKSEIAQPVFLVVTAAGILLLLVFIFIPYNTFGEDVKMLKDSGLTLIMVLSLLVAVYAAGNSIAEEIEGRTALTVLSKPVGRRQFVFGKFLGIVWVVLLIFLILGGLFLATIPYKVVYDARETANPEPIWQDCYMEMARTVPGLILAFMETVVLTSLSVAISTRLPLLANFIIMFSVYVLGHLTPLIVHSALVRELEPVVFVGRLIATVVPVLDHFNVQGAVAAGVPVPTDYMGWSLVYCILYAAIAMLFAFILFEDRDLA